MSEDYIDAFRMMVYFMQRQRYHIGIDLAYGRDKCYIGYKG